MNKTTLASFRALLGEIFFAMIGNVKDKYKIKKTYLNKHVADIADDAQFYNR